jgi:hypothetical protein
LFHDAERPWPARHATQRRPTPYARPPPPLHAARTSPRQDLTLSLDDTTAINSASSSRHLQAPHCRKPPATSRHHLRLPARQPPRRCLTSRIHSIATAHVLSAAITASWPDRHCCR